MINRRAVLLSGLAYASAGLAQGVRAPVEGETVAPSVVDVAKVMSFTCGYCLASESQDATLEAAVTARGGRYVHAPIPEDPASLAARERTYYAAREMDPAFGHAIKNALYKGSQDAQVSLESFSQVYYWLEQAFPNDLTRVEKLILDAQASAAAAALQRAVRLTINAGVQSLPTYVLLVNGRIATTIDRSTAGSDSVTVLRESVLSRLKSL